MQKEIVTQIDVEFSNYLTNKCLFTSLEYVNYIYSNNVNEHDEIIDKTRYLSTDLNNLWISLLSLLDTYIYKVNNYSKSYLLTRNISLKDTSISYGIAKHLYKKPCKNLQGYQFGLFFCKEVCFVDLTQHTNDGTELFASTDISIKHFF